jgi:hypothetical protein
VRALAYAVAALGDHRGRIGNGLGFDHRQSWLDGWCWWHRFRWSCSLPFTLATASGLFPAAFLASLGGPISLTGMPRPPVLGGFSTSGTAITSLWPRRHEPAFAIFKQAPATARVPTAKAAWLTRRQRAGTLKWAHGRVTPERSGGGKVVLPAATLRRRRGRRSSRFRRQTHASLLPALHTCEGMKLQEAREGQCRDREIAEWLRWLCDNGSVLGRCRHRAKGHRSRDWIDGVSSWRSAVPE